MDPTSAETSGRLLTSVTGRRLPPVAKDSNRSDVYGLGFRRNAILFSDFSYSTDDITQNMTVIKMNKEKMLTVISRPRLPFCSACGYNHKNWIPGTEYRDSARCVLNVSSGVNDVPLHKWFGVFFQVSGAWFNPRSPAHLDAFYKGKIESIIVEAGKPGKSNEITIPAGFVPVIKLIDDKNLSDIQPFDEPVTFRADSASDENSGDTQAIWWTRVPGKNVNPSVQKA